MSNNQIPTAARVAVRGRDLHRCQRCGVRGTEVHHRRSKSVHDEHRHCPCNLVYLCGWGNHTGCHGWVHSHPFEAKPLGLIVVRSVALPELQPIYSAPRQAWVRITCDGQALLVAQPPREEHHE